MTITLKSGIVDFFIFPQTAYANCPIIFDATSSFSPFGSIVAYEWDFGDGNTTTTSSPSISHAYEVPSTFDVNLTILDDFGTTNSTIANITVLSDASAPTTFT